MRRFYPLNCAFLAFFHGWFVIPPPSSFDLHLGLRFTFSSKDELENGDELSYAMADIQRVICNHFWKVCDVL